MKPIERAPWSSAYCLADVIRTRLGPGSAAGRCLPLAGCDLPDQPGSLICAETGERAAGEADVVRHLTAHPGRKAERPSHLLDRLEADLGEDEARQVRVEDVDAEGEVVVLDRVADLVELERVQLGQH